MAVFRALDSVCLIHVKHWKH